jgi:hypothetical protein
MNKRLLAVCFSVILGIVISLSQAAITVAQVPDVLYHYTSQAGHDGILSSKKINPSLIGNNPKDARYGDGQYFSDILPGTKSSASLSATFIRIPFQGPKFEYYIGVNVKGLNVVKGRENVFVALNDSPLDISKRLVSSGKN